MKKLLILFVAFVSVVNVSLGQKNKVQTAWNYYKYDDLQRAAEAIELAAVHEQTSNSAKTWYYRGLIYLKSYKHEKFASLDPDPLGKAAESLQKALKLEPDFEYKDEVNQSLQIAANQLFSLGVERFTAKEYEKALQSFEGVLSISPGDEMATLNAAYSADRSGQKVKAKQYYNELISKDYKESRIYVFQSGILKADGDTAAALAVIEKGRKLFPADNNLVIEELNIYLFRGDDQKALESLNYAIQGDPGNANLHFALGTVYDKTGKKAEAATSYKKAIELKSDYFDAYYNLGAMYFNEAAELANKANDLKSNTEYAKAKEKFDAKFKDAQPYLEKALELNPGDQNTMTSLKQLYVRLNEMDKYKALESKTGK